MTVSEWALDELLEHSQGSLWLVHGDHVACIKDSEEVQVVEALESTCSLAIDLPVNIFEGIELILARPLALSRPGLAASPVADEVLVSRVDQDVVFGLKEISDLWSKIGHPVTEEEGVDKHVALGPLSLGWNTENLLCGVGHEQVVGWTEVVAQWWLVALLPDVVNVESGLDWVAKDHFHGELALLHGKQPSLGLDQNLASLESSVQDGVLSLANETVLVSKACVGGILVVRVDEAIANSRSLEVELKVSGVLKLEVVRDGWDVVAGVGLSSDVEVLALELRVLLEEFDHELSHVLGDLILVHVVVNEAGVRVASSYWLVHVQQIGVGIPGVWVALKRLAILLKLVGAVLVEESDLRGTSRATSEPEHERVILGIGSGLKPPVEDVVVVLEVNKTRVPRFVDEGARIGVRRALGIGSSESKEG